MSRPNLLVVLADQFRAAAMGCMGQDPTHTPALDRLAREGRVCTDAVSTYPVCSPARAMLLTGRYPWSNGVPFNVNSETATRGVGLLASARCWSDVLSEEGYRLGYIGKWHLTPPTAEDEVHGEGRREDGKVWDAWTPPEQRHGFSFWYSHGCCDRHFEPHFWTSDAAQDSPHRVHQWSAAHETDVAIEFLRGAADSAEPHAKSEPFALMVSFNPPHQPFDQVPPEHLSRYEELSDTDLLGRPNVDLTSELGADAVQVSRQYFAAVSAVDEQIGRLLEQLEELGVADDTVVVFTSDHGMQLGSHGLMYKNVPFEESSLVPFVVRWPGHVPVGCDDILLGSVDVAPTLLGLLGLADRIPAEVEGQDCSAALLGLPGAPRPEAALHLGPALDPGQWDVRGLRTRSHKLVAEYRQDEGLRTRLVDLRADPYELGDVSHDNPELLSSMLARLVQMLVRTQDPWPGLPVALAQQR